MLESNKSSIQIPYIYITYLFLAWLGYVAFLYPRIVVIDGLVGEIAQEIVRVVIFLAPLYFIHKIIQPLSFEAMGISNKLLTDVKIGVISSVIFLSIVLPLTLLSSGKSISFDSVSSVPFWSAVSIAVITEEIVFRGYLLPVFEQHYKKARAILTTVLLFVLIHYPGWWLLETHSTIGGWVQASGSIFFLGVILSIVFIRYKSLLACIMIHSTNNLVAAIAG